MSAYGKEEVVAFHRGGKVAVSLPKPLKTKDDLCLAYTPGVAHAVKAVAADPKAVYDVTAKPNLVAVVSDGTAILGLGDLGAAASIPVMEGKAVRNTIVPSSQQYSRRFFIRSRTMLMMGLSRNRPMYISTYQP